ncbi:MAG: DUF262 domain-containing protein [Paludibacteraceae bacterium]|nr:DUF262 domain-containing protein [Paludibacteraceae bacterium]
MDVSPLNQNIDTLFSNTTYYIDFYQRQYKWDSVPVIRLLDDVFYKFTEEHKRFAQSSIPSDQIITRYSWYYMNTYVTNLDEESNRLYIVDGQQRLTTLTLILIKLYHQADSFQSDLKDWIADKIVGRSGYKKTFWLNHEIHEPTLKALFDGDETIPTDTGITAVNLAKNYNIISKRLDNELKDKCIFERFVFYFMYRLVIINLKVEQTDVPMVFEVINDRGVRLKPYEILKGKLLGQIDKDELNALKLNELWDGRVNKINANNPDQIDNFFIYLLKAKFANTIGESRKFDKEYHRALFAETNLNLDHNQKNVKQFLQNDFSYYTDLYIKLQDYSVNYDKNYRYIYYNSLTDRGQQFLLILSACKVHDAQEEDKIKVVSYQIDRLFCLLQLQRAYDSNKFNEMMYQISERIREKDVSEIENAFNDSLIEILQDKYSNSDLSSTFSYGYFKETGIDLDKRFKRYFFARIEEFISENTHMDMRHNLYNLVVNTGSTNGFHIEHILAENNENYALFGNDEERFRSERNRLGGLLLLKGKDNISSNNETYTDKLTSYANTLYWNETLRADSYKSHLDFTNWISASKLNFRPMDKFGPDELEERQKLLFEIVKCIWNS